MLDPDQSVRLKDVGREIANYWIKRCPTDSRLDWDYDFGAERDRGRIMLEVDRLELKLDEKWDDIFGAVREGYHEALTASSVHISYRGITQSVHHLLD